MTRFLLSRIDPGVWDASMKTTFLPLAWLIMAVSVVAEPDDAPAPWQGVLSQIGLLPGRDSPYGAGGPSGLEQQLDRKLNERETALLERDDGGAWKTHSDDLLSFELPDDDLLKVELFNDEDRPELKIVGGAVGTTDRSFRKVYRITFSDGVSYGLILVTQALWFDDGICLCGPIDLKTIVPAGGTLLELSQLPDGKVKKFQALNSTHRAVLFEWTHSAITQSAYARIGASIRFKQASPRTTEEWVALSKEWMEGREDGLAWLRSGMSREEVVKYMGPPDSEESDKLVYVHEGSDEDDGGWRTTVRLPLENNILQRFHEDWRQFERIKPARGTRAWFRETLLGWSDQRDAFEEGKEVKLPAEDVELIRTAFHTHAPAADDEEWEFWCGVIADLARVGVKDPKAVELILKRSGDAAFPHHQTRSVLELYERPELVPFVHNRLRFLMEGSETALHHRGEFHNLLATLKRDDAASVPLLRDALRHKDDKLRSDAAYFVRKLPRKEAVGFLRALLADPAPDVRRRAILNIQHLCTINDKGWLNKQLASEEDKYNRKLMDEKIHQLE